MAEPNILEYASQNIKVEEEESEQTEECMENEGPECASLTLKFETADGPEELFLEEEEEEPPRQMANPTPVVGGRHINISKLCRLCAKVYPTGTGTRLSPPPVKLSAYLKKFFSVELSECDGMPKRICHRCVDAIESWVCLLREVSEAQEFLARHAVVPDPLAIVSAPVKERKRGNNIMEKMAEWLPWSQSRQLDFSGKVGSGVPTFEELLGLPHMKEGQQPTRPEIVTSTYELEKGALSLARTTKRPHSPTNPYLCGLCQYKCREKITLSLHVHQHISHNKHLNSVPCPHCNVMFLKVNTLISHQEEHIKNPKAQLSFPCPECDKEFVSERNLKSHSTVHFRQNRQKVSEKNSNLLMAGFKPIQPKPDSSGAKITPKSADVQPKTNTIPGQQGWTTTEPVAPTAPTNSNTLSDNLVQVIPKLETNVPNTMANSTNISNSQPIIIQHSSQTFLPHTTNIMPIQQSLPSQSLLPQQFVTNQTLPNYLLNPTPGMSQIFLPSTPGNITPIQPVIMNPSNMVPLAPAKSIPISPQGIISKWDINKDFPCGVCETNFPTVTSFKEHMELELSKLRNKVLPCGFCNMRFKKVYSLCAHLRRHRVNPDAIDTFRCTSCSQRFNDQSTWKNHLLSHSEHKRFKCKLCSKVFKYRVSWRQHFVRAHSNYLEKISSNGLDIVPDPNDPGTS